MTVFAGYSQRAVAAGLEIQRLELSFADGRAQATITRNGKLRAHADILYSGAGLLEGYWEADGRIIGRISRHLAGSGTITIPGPPTPIPTIDPGTHQLRFVVTEPAASFSAPSLIYFVEPEGATCSTAAEIRPLAPADGAGLPFAAARFKWEPAMDVTVYMISFYGEAEDRQIFSAYTKDPSYRLRGKIIRSMFKPGESYRWQVTGYDRENRAVCRFAPRTFTFSGNRGNLREKP
jgi:hypothetical protein